MDLGSTFERAMETPRRQVLFVDDVRNLNGRQYKILTQSRVEITCARGNDVSAPWKWNF